MEELWKWNTLIAAAQAFVVMFLMLVMNSNFIEAVEWSVVVGIAASILMAAAGNPFDKNDGTGNIFGLLLSAIFFTVSAAAVLVGELVFLGGVLATLWLLITALLALDETGQETFQRFLVILPYGIGTALGGVILLSSGQEETWQ